MGEGSLIPYLVGLLGAMWYSRQYVYLRWEPSEMGASCQTHYKAVLETCVWNTVL